MSLTKGHTIRVAVRNKKKNSIVIRAYACAYALKYNVEPALLTAVLAIESRPKDGSSEFREGRVKNKQGIYYYMPGGIHQCFLKKWRIDDTEINIAVAAHALKNTGYSWEKQKNRLHTYNATCNSAYLNAIYKLKKKYRHVG